MKTLSQKTLKELLHYDPDTGALTWKYRHREYFESLKSFRSFNIRWRGREAGTTNRNGYVDIDIFGKKYRSSRLIWFYMHGRWPKDQIDHINHIRDDNRFINLREATNQINSHNQKLAKNNTSGHCGVGWYKPNNKWQAGIMISHEQIYLGRFDSIEAAICARKTAEVKYGFHKNHGMAA